MGIRQVSVSLCTVLSLIVACSTVPAALTPKPSDTADMPNPASVYCEEQGGTVDIRTQEDGGQVGFCVFPDGSECEEWAFYRGECEPAGANMPNPASVYCDEQGGTVDIRTQEGGGQAGFCVWPDGSECDEWAFYRGECVPGVANTPNPASVYCEEQGGTVDIRTQEGGEQAGFCVFPDGSECEEWAFFRGECKPGSAGPSVYVPDWGALQSFAYQGWKTYTNEAYGFSVRYPSDWTVSEVTGRGDTMAGHRIDLLTPGDAQVVLFIAFKGVDEQRNITPTGMGAGDVVERGSLVFLGEELSRAALVADGKDLGVLYGSGEVSRAPLTFWINLHYGGSPTTDPGLSPGIEEQADRIVTSIQMVD